MQIIVTREDWDKGQRDDPLECAIAQAIRRSYADVEDVIVSREGIVVDGRHYKHTTMSFYLMQLYDGGHYGDLPKELILKE